MGKFDNRNKLIANGRLTGLKTSNNNNNNNNNNNLISKFDPRLDARLKLIQKHKSPIFDSNAGFINKNRLKQAQHTQKQQQKQQQIHDARQLLLKKQQKIVNFKSKYYTDDNDDDEDEYQADEYIEENDYISDDFSNKKEPIMIVTGLANVRKDGDKLRVINRNKSAIDNHMVIAHGSNTLVTLNNNNLKETNKTDYIELDKTSIKANFQPIRIRIDNDIQQQKYNYSNNNKIEQNYRFNNNNNNNNNNRIETSYDQQMDYEENTNGNEFINSSRKKSSANNLSIGGVGYLNNGYKLIVSNLHPRVTEDDVLELFSDIGPIKRARFLDKGLAEVVYVKLEHAKEAISKYDKNELDGRPMKIELSDNATSYNKLNSNNSVQSPQPAKIPMASNTTTIKSLNVNSSNLKSSSTAKSSSNDATNSYDNSYSQNTLSNRFKLANANRETVTFTIPDSVSTAKNKELPNKVNVDTSIIHQVLFNKKSTNSSSPVTFTVKL